jgi:hydrogenase expression/formation protein HypC
MCVAVPGKILSIDEFEMASIDFGGTQREVSVSLLESPQVGEYVIVHAGFALHKVDADEAQETIEMFRQVLNDEPL